MDDKVFVCVFITLLEFGCYKSAEVTTDSMVAEILNEGKTFTTSLASCTLNAEKLKGFVITGPKGERGNIGDSGLPGVRGVAGPQGPEGIQGIKGDKGDKGNMGPKGETGKPGHQGIKGEKGETGDLGEEGPRGLKGERGSIGISGLPGLDGTCQHVCPTPIRAPSPGKPPEGEGGSGTFYEPLHGLCNMKLSEDITQIFNGTTYVNPESSFKVRCDAATHLTCLETSPFTNYNGDGAFVVNNTEPFWLSEKLYDLTKFYGVPMKQIIWLQERSTQIRQTIRYHCKNSFVIEQPETALLLYGWNDLTIGPYGDYGPLNYNVPPKTHKCKPEEPKTEWRYSDIVVMSKSAKRLPIVDFRIQDIRKEETQSFFLELVELCFG